MKIRNSLMTAALLTLTMFIGMQMAAQDGTPPPSAQLPEVSLSDSNLPASIKDKLNQASSLKKRLKGALKSKRLVNSTSGNFIMTGEDGSLKLASKAKPKEFASTEWLIEPAAGNDMFTQIRNPRTGARIHVEWQDVAKAEKHWDGAWALMWVPEEADGGTYFFNRYKNKYLTYQNGQLTLSASKTPNALWKIEKATKGFASTMGGKIVIGLAILIGLIVVGVLYSILT